MPGLGGLLGVSAAGRSQEECRRGAGARRGVMNWNDSGGGGTFSRDRRGLLSPARWWWVPTCQLASLSTCRLVGKLGSRRLGKWESWRVRCWWAGSTEVSCPLVVGAVEGGGERRKERQFTGGVREKKCERRGVDTEWGV